MNTAQIRHKIWDAEFIQQMQLRAYGLESGKVKGKTRSAVTAIAIFISNIK